MSEFYNIIMLSKFFLFVDFLFSTVHTTPFLYVTLHFGVLHLLHASIATIRPYPTGFKPARSNQIASNSVCRYRGPIDLYCSLILYAIHYGDTVEQTTCTFSRSIRANDITTAFPYIERDAICQNLGADRAGKGDILCLTVFP